MKIWDFDKDKNELQRIVAEKYGLWCFRCGSTWGLSLHHIRPRGQFPAKLVITENGISFTRDDPYNLRFCCISCHNWIHTHPDLAKKGNFLKENH